ncbi:MAG: homoserine kinase [Polyangiaceae bacterium]|nr:homoserine kinase [Polyangiaceae bacterium]
MAIRTVLNASELESFLRDFGLGSPSNVCGIEAGTVNTSYAMTLGTGRYFLRLYEEQGPEGAAREVALLRHLAASGVSTPMPVAAVSGAFVRTLAGKPAALFPWVEGKMLCQRAVTPAAARAIGNALARIHAAGCPADIARALGHGRFGPCDLIVRCERILNSIDPDARAQAGTLRHAVANVARRRNETLPAGLVHGDLFRDNVLWQEGRIAALLDFESACVGPFVYDLAVTILSWSFGDVLLPEIARAMVEGYREERDLSQAEREGLFDEAILATLRFTITRIVDDTIRVGKRWQRFVARREALEQLGPRGLCEVLGL